MSLSLGTLGLLWLWATLAGLDLVSILQVQVARPLIAGPIAGWLLGDVDTGLRIGAVLELFALDVVPVGSSKYPDFGAATIGAVGYGVGTDWNVTLGASVLVGVALATLGGASLPLGRRLTARVIRARTAGLAEGDPETVRAVHLTGLAHDVLRSSILAALAVATAVTGRWLEVRPGPALGGALTSVALVGAAWGVAHGAMTTARTGPRWRWAATGLAAGTLLAWQR